MIWRRAQQILSQHPKKTLKPTSQHARSRFPRQAISAPRDITRTETPQGTRAGAPHIPSQQARSRFPRKRSLRRVTSHEVKLRKAHALGLLTSQTNKPDHDWFHACAPKRSLRRMTSHKLKLRKVHALGLLTSQTNNKTR